MSLFLNWVIFTASPCEVVCCILTICERLKVFDFILTGLECIRHREQSTELSSTVRSLYCSCRTPSSTMDRTDFFVGQQRSQCEQHRNDEGSNTGSHWIHLSGYCK